MKVFFSTLLCFFFFSGSLYCQTLTIDKTKFFSDTSVLNATLSTDLSKLLKHKQTGYQLTGTFTTSTGDSIINDHVLLEIRGHFRKDYCYLPPLKVNFKYQKSSVLHKLGSLKLVSACNVTAGYQQYLLKEFLIYKIYNLLTDMSFHVRLLNLNLTDSTGKKKTIKEYAFFVEDIKDVAKRNNCVELKNLKLITQATDRRQMTMVSLFQYMIGNTDWGISVNHNTRLIVSEIDSLKRPFVVPYDFDYSGLVNTGYAVPDEKLDIQNVQQRLYRGYARTVEELNEVLDIFKLQKEKIYSLIKNFELLTPKSKREMTGYLDDFFEQINKPERVKYLFIQHARED